MSEEMRKKFEEAAINVEQREKEESDAAIEEQNQEVLEAKKEILEEEETPPVEPTTEEPAVEATEENPAPVIEEGEFSFDPKIKVMDDEVEIPDFLAKSVTNAEQAKIVKDIMEKSYGLDKVKEKRDFFKDKATKHETELNDLNTQFKQMNESLDFYEKLIKNDDIQTFQQYADIKDDQILKRAADIIRYRELTPEQKLQYDNGVQSRQRLYALELENNQFKQRTEVEIVEQKGNELDSVLSNDTTQSIASSFDSRVGYGAFRKEVIQRAAYIEQTTGKSLTPEEAVNETVKILGLTPSQSTAPQQSQTPVTTETTVNPETNVVTTVKPTIPKVNAGNKSPTRPIVKSIDDIRKLAAQFDY